MTEETTAFANAMTGQHEPGLVAERAQLLTAATFGIWLTARIDPASAARAADAAAACTRSWQQAPVGPGNSAEASTASTVSSLTHGPGPASA